MADFPKEGLAPFVGRVAILGQTRTRIVSANNVTALAIFAGEGGLFGWLLSNNAAAARYAKFYDKATIPTVGTDVPAFTVLLQSLVNPIPCLLGSKFLLGCWLGITVLAADNDTTAPAAGDVTGVVISG